MPEDPSTPAPQVTPAGAAPAPGPERTGMFADPIVRIIAGVIALIVIAFLLFVASGLFFGYLRPAAPRTFAEMKLAEGQSLIDAGVIEPEIWRNQISLLIDSKQYAAAQNLIDKGEGMVDDEWGQTLLWMQAKLYAAQGDLDLALETADKAQEAITAEYERILAIDELPNRAKAYGISGNFYYLALLKAQIHNGRGEFVEAQKELQTYIDGFPNEAGVLIDLADLKAKNGDIEGARADYKRALIFMPDDPDARAGLEAIGAE